MKHRDFHAGQSALGLMTRNTEAMLAPRMAQWEAFGKGLQDANAIVQNRHAFNEQLAQNRIQNEFKNKEFGFREKELQENQRQFDQRHALDKQNSFYEQKYKESATAYNYWRMREEEKEKRGSLSVKSKPMLDAITAKLQVLNMGEQLIEKAPEYLGKGIHMGINKTLNRIWGFNGLYELNDKQNEWVGMMEAYKNAYRKDIFGNDQSKDKRQQLDDFIDQKYAGAEQFITRAKELGADVIGRIKSDLEGLDAMGYKDEYLDFIRKEIAKREKFYNTPQESKEPAMQKSATMKELEKYLK